MSISDDINRLANEIAQNLRSIMDEKQIDQSEVGQAVGITGNAVSQMLKGKATQQYAKLALIAKRLGTDPNHILGVDHERCRSLFKGAIQGALEGLGYPTADALTVAAIALRVFDRAPAGRELEEWANNVAEFQAREYIATKRQS